MRFSRILPFAAPSSLLASPEPAQPAWLLQSSASIAYARSMCADGSSQRAEQCRTMLANHAACSPSALARAGKGTNAQPPHEVRAGSSQENQPDQPQHSSSFDLCTGADTRYSSDALGPPRSDARATMMCHHKTYCVCPATSTVLAFLSSLSSLAE